MTKLLIRSGPIILGFVILLVLGCHSDENQPRQSEAIRVTTVRPQRTEVVHSITVVGHAEPNEQAILYAKAAGYLESITADIGSWVRSGQLLATIDDPETRHDLERQRADRKMREQIYQRLSATKDKSPDMVSQLEVDRAKGEYEASAAAEKRVQQLVDNALIRAPFDGVITDRWVDPGTLIQLATTSQPVSARIVRIMNFDTVRFVVEIPEKDATRIAVNSEAIVRFPDIPGKEFPGRVARYAWAVSPTTRTMTAEVEFPNPDHLVRPGMYGKTEITVERLTDALVVPSETVIVTGKDRYVWVVENGRAKRAPVDVGKDDGVRAEIRKGLDGSENIVLAGRQMLKDSATVIVSGSN